MHLINNTNLNEFWSMWGQCGSVEQNQGLIRIVWYRTFRTVQ